MISVDYSYFVNAPVDRVFEFIGNPENDPVWQTSCASSRMTSDGPLGAGSRYEIAFEFLGRKMSFEGMVSEHVAPHQFGYRAVGGPFTYEGSYHFVPECNGTRVDWRFSAEPGRFFGIVPVSLIRKALLKQVEKDAVRLRALLELAPAGGGQEECDAPNPNMPPDSRALA